HRPPPGCCGRHCSSNSPGPDNTPEPAESDHRTSLPAVEIDQLDARLLLMLRAHPRVGVVEIARRLGVARGTVQSRMEKLSQRGVITDFGPAIEPARMGYPVLAFVSLEIVQ